MSAVCLSVCLCVCFSGVPSNDHKRRQLRHTAASTHGETGLFDFGSSARRKGHVLDVELLMPIVVTVRVLASCVEKGFPWAPLVWCIGVVLHRNSQKTSSRS